MSMQSRTKPDMFVVEKLDMYSIFLVRKCLDRLCLLFQVLKLQEGFLCITIGVVVLPCVVLELFE